MSNTILEIHFNCTIDASGAPVLTPVNAPRLDVTTTPWEVTLHPLNATDPEDEDVIFSVSPPTGYTITVSSSGTPSGEWTEESTEWVSEAVDIPQDHGIVVEAVPDSSPSIPPASSTVTIKVKKPGRPFDHGSLPVENRSA